MLSNIHHIQHQANGGTHRYNNLILMHPNCHRSIHAAKRAIRKLEVSKKSDTLMRA
ncbi:HNH endonuclease [Candidatus Glomeribacter gigasporarum]|uniref:HNH endonuclease n=1 Tax=Candidatus Glomeribacter gigasporarum TaxID=132144 RepID=UPI0009D9DD56